MKTQFPLYWPEGWPVTTKKTMLRRKRSWLEGLTELERICKGMKITEASLTSNYNGYKFDGSTGVSFVFNAQGKEMALFCDRYFSATDNLWAIVERMRASLLIYKYNLTFYEFQN